jgi:hypothetical protein
MNEGFQELPPVEANGRSARTAPRRDITARIELEPPSGALGSLEGLILDGESRSQGENHAQTGRVPQT